MTCPCGSGKTFEACCGPFLSGAQNAPTPEALMRSRYTAFTKGDIAYLKKTLSKKSRADFNEADAREWSRCEWRGLEILKAEGDTVEFQAKYKTQGKVLEHHEVSKFAKEDGHWVFVDGDSHVHEEGQGHNHQHHAPVQQVVREAPKTGRNDPCPCGSGQKYKKCHGA